jgi:uncharacterized membrane protein
MAPVLSKHRVIFIDLLRAFAVLNMVQGHTVDTLLGDTYRNFESVIFSIWIFNRGMTAPLFMVSAGCVFTYLFRLHKEPFGKNPRVKRGLRRAALLILIGYVLRNPSPFLIYFPNATAEQWKTFFAVDVLQLIGFGLLAILLICYMTEKFKTQDKYLFSLFAIVNVILYVFFQKINWTEYFHPAIAGYFYPGSGSNFPLFPWLTYIFVGGILGSYLAKNQGVFKTFRFTFQILISGVVFVLLSIIGNEIEIYYLGQSYLWTTSPNLVLIRIGIVLIFISICAFAALKINTIPKILILLGRNTLLIYIVHLVFLYGSPWSLGIILLWNHSFNPYFTILAAMVMIGLMTLMVYLINKFNVKNKALVT